MLFCFDEQKNINLKKKELKYFLPMGKINEPAISFNNEPKNPPD